MEVLLVGGLLWENLLEEEPLYPFSTYKDPPKTPCEFEFQSPDHVDLSGSSVGLLGVFKEWSL